MCLSLFISLFLLQFFTLRERETERILDPMIRAIWPVSAKNTSFPWNLISERVSLHIQFNGSKKISIWKRKGLRALPTSIGSFWKGGSERLRKWEREDNLVDRNHSKESTLFEKNLFYWYNPHTSNSLSLSSLPSFPQFWNLVSLLTLNACHSFSFSLNFFFSLFISLSLSLLTFYPFLSSSLLNVCGWWWDEERSNSRSKRGRK